MSAVWTRPTPSHVLALAAFLLPLVATLAPMGMAPLLALAALAALAVGGYRDLRRLEPMRIFATLIILLGIVGTASALWSVLPEHSLLEGLRFLAISAAGMTMVAVALGLGERRRELVRRALLWGFVIALGVIAAAVLANEILGPSMPDGALMRWIGRHNRFDRSATTLALAFWPLALGLIGRKRRAQLPVLATATIVIVLSLHSRSAVVCLAVSFLVVPAAWVLPRITAAAIGAGVIALVTIVPALPLDMDFVASVHQRLPWLQDSAVHRLAIWHFAIDRIHDRPLLGWGLDSSRALPNGSDVIVDPRIPDLEKNAGQWMPLHPHNAALQWRLELGLPGAAFATLIVLWLLWRVGTARALPRSQQAGALALVAAALVVAFVSYGFWQAWWQSTLWLVGALALALVRAEPLGAQDS